VARDDRWAAWPAVVVLLVLFATRAALADGPELRRFEFVETHMGSEFRLLLYCADEAAARSASRAAFDRIAALDRTLSDYDNESELSRLGDASGGPPVRVSADLLDVLIRAKSWHERSSGAFDATIGPVGRLWRQARRMRKLPDPDRLAEALERVGSDKLAIDPAAGTVQLAVPGMKLDVGGIAKGYASQAAVDVLRREGVSRCLVAGAGDVVAGDPPPGTSAWVVGLAPADDPGDSPRRFVELANAAVSTSGDAERFVEIDGVRYSHILDPRSGQALTRRGAVTVVAPSGATADALATAASVLGPEKGAELVEATPGASALFVELGEGGPVESATSRFRSLDRPPEGRPPQVGLNPAGP